MKKVLLTSTCAAAISVFAAWTFDSSYAQQTQNTGASQQEEHHKAGAETKEMKPGAAKAGGAMNGAANENKERTQNTNAAEQQNTESNKAGATNRHESTAEQKGQNEKSKMQSGEASSQEKMKSGEPSQEKMKEKTHAGAASEKEPMRSGEASQKEQKEHMKSGATEEKGKAQTGAAEEKGKTQNGAAAQSETSKSRMQTGETSQKRATEGRAAAEPGNAGATGHNEAMAHGKMKMNAQQASDFRSRLEKRGEVTRSSVNFNVDVGVAVPESVRLEPIPTDIIAEYPEFRGYDVVMVEDEIVIVDPHTREVVEVIGGSTRSAAAAHRERLRLTREQDEVIRRHIHARPEKTVEFDERIDARVPDTVVLEPLPGPVVAEVPEVRSYDYFIDRNDHVVIVDPETHEVVGIVED